MDDPTLTVLVLLGLAAVAAGFVDAVVGGGGLIQLPALLLGLPNAAPMQILATNKLASHLRHDGELGDVLPPDQAGPADLPADDGAGLRRLVLRRAGRQPDPARGVRADRAGRADRGRRLRAAQARARARPPRCGTPATGTSPPRWPSASSSASTTARSGPGTGSFLVFALVGLLGYSFLEASAKARLANWATNLGALALFVPQGAVLWKVGLVMGACNLVGGYVGARVAVSRGARFVRVFFIVVVSAFIVRIGGDVLGRLVTG